MKLNLKKRPQSALGLSLGDGWLRAAVVVRSKAGCEVVKSASHALALDLLHPEPELVGREVRNHLDAAGIHERTCAVALPPSWIMSLHTRLPDLPPGDVDSFLQLEAERGFPCDADQLQVARSFHRSETASYVTQLAVRKEQLDRLSAVLKAAGLRPASYSLGLASLPGVVPQAGAGRITVMVEPQGAALVAAAGGGIAAFRTFEATIDSEAGERVVNGGGVARELRITFEQVPDDLRRGMRELSLGGDPALVRQLGERLGDWAAAAGLSAREIAGPGDSIPDLMARGVAAQWLEPAGPPIEFLPPRPGRWEALLARTNAKRLGTAGMAVGAAAALVLAAFAWQEIRLISLRSQWKGMEAQVAALKGVQDRIRAYRPWYDRSFQDLQILSRVTGCFPQNGSVTARSLDIHKAGGVTTVSITGTARDGQALLRTQDELHKAREVQGLKLEAISGKMPAQFTFTFRWMGTPGT
jgi:hypothetical protein